MPDNNSKVFGFSFVKGALVEVKVQLVVAEDLHYPTDLSMMFAKSL